MVPRFLLAFVVLFACGSSVIAKGEKCQATLKHIDDLLNIYELEHPLKHFPSTLREFQNFAAKKGKSLDLMMFSRFEYKRRGTSLLMSYTCKETGESAASGCSIVITY